MFFTLCITFDVCFPLFWLDDSFRCFFLADWTTIPSSALDQYFPDANISCGV